MPTTRRKRLPRSFCSAFVVSLITWSPLAAAETRPIRLGVVVSQASNVSTEDGRGISDGVAEALRKRHNIKVISGAEAERRYPANGLAEDCSVRAVCVRDIGERLKADQMLFLSVVRLGNRVQVDPTWADVRKGRSKSQPAFTFDATKKKQRRAAFKEAAGGLLPEGLVVQVEKTAKKRKKRRRRGSAVVAETTYGFTTATYVASGIAFATLASSIVLVAAGTEDYNALEGRCDVVDCSNDAETQAKLKDLGVRSTITGLLLGAAALATATAVVLYLNGEDQATLAELSVGATPGGVVVGGRF